MVNHIQLLGRATSIALLLYFSYRTFIKSDKPAAFIFILGLMIIAEDYMQYALYLPGLEAGSIRFSELIILYLLVKNSGTEKIPKAESKVIDTLWIPFILLFLFAVFNSSYPFVAARNFRFAVLSPFLIYLISSRGFDTEEDYTKFTLYLAVLITLLAAASIDDLKLDKIWFHSAVRAKYEFFGKETKGRYGSFFLNPNFFASFLILSLPLMFIQIKSRPISKKIYLLLANIIGTLALIITYTRAAYVAILLSSFFSFFYGITKIFKIKQLVFSVILLVLSILIIFPGAINKITGRASTIEEDAETSRVYIWTNALKILKEHPIIGVGLTEGDYKLAAIKMTGYEVVETRQGAVVEGFMDQPHNSYISLALWVSSASVFIFLFMNYKVLKLGKIVVNNPAISQNFKIFTLGAQISIIAYLVIIFFDTQLLLRTANSLYWMLFGLIVSIYRRTYQNTQPLSSEKK